GRAGREGGNGDRVDRGRQRPAELHGVQFVNHREERGEGLPGARGGRDQDALPLVDQRDRVRLGLREGRELRREPVPHEGLEEGEHLVPGGLLRYCTYHVSAPRAIATYSRLA